MLVLKTEVLPIECVVRGYLSGSGWVEYQETGKVCGVPLPRGLVESSKFDEPILPLRQRQRLAFTMKISPSRELKGSLVRTWPRKSNPFH
jgi:phosphoribosylaminoimidazole-succinocarboxamide synthase